MSPISHCGPLTAKCLRSAISLRICTPLLPLPSFKRIWKVSSKSLYFFLLHKRSEEHTSELQSRFDLVCRLLLEKKKKNKNRKSTTIPAHNNTNSHNLNMRL